MTAASLSPSLLRQFAEALPSSSQLHVAEEHRLERDACQQSFAHFLPYWRFVNRETGAICSFVDP